MRRWLAALAFVPAVAWGQVDCRSVTAHEAFAEYAAKVADAKQAGVGSRQIMQGVGNAPAPVRAAWHEAIRLTYSSAGYDFSTIVRSMQAECYLESRR